MGLLVADTCLVDTAVLIATIAGLLYYWSTSTFQYWQKRGVKTVAMATPFLGSLKPMFTMERQLGLHFQDMYQELEGERYGGYYKTRQPALLLRDPALIKLVLIKDFASFHDNDMEANEHTNPMFAYNLFGMKGANWKYARSKISPIFSTGKIRNMFPLMMEVCEELRASILRTIECATSAGEFEAKNLAGNFTTDVVASCAFALQCHSLRDGDNKFRRMGKEIMTTGKLRGILTMIIFFIPQFEKILSFCGVKFIPDHIVNFFRGLVREAMEFRDKNNVKRNDLIQLLMQLKKLGGVEEEAEDVLAAKNETVAEDNTYGTETGKMEFTHDALTAQAVGFFLDGYETSSIALSFAMHELAMNPDIQGRLRADLRKAVASSDGKLTYNALRECVYLDHVMRETMRLYPAGGALSKVCTKRYQIPGTNVKLEVGTPIAIPVYALHHDPQYYPDPETFDPDRFSEENKKNRVPFTYLTFGEGPRKCVGQRFALAQVKAALATVVLNFQLTPSPKTQHPIVLDPNYFMPNATGGLHLLASPIQV